MYRPIRTDDVAGAWSFDDSIDRLIMVIDFQDDEGEDVLDFTISVDGTMTAIEEIDGSSEMIIIENNDIFKLILKAPL